MHANIKGFAVFLLSLATTAIAGQSLAIGESQGSGLSDISALSHMDVGEVIESDVIELGQSEGLEFVSQSSIYKYRHDWGIRKGKQVLTLRWSAIKSYCNVFVSIGEGKPGGPRAGKFIGAAKYTVHNVAPANGSVAIWVDIAWGERIPLYVDYLAIC